MPLFDHTAGQWQRDKTHCPRGHSYDAENTVRNAKGGRMCRTCRKEQSRQAWVRYKSKLTPRYPVEVSAAHLPTGTPEIHTIRVSLEREGIPGVVALGEVSAALWAVRRAMRNDGVAQEGAYVSVYDNCIVISWPVD